MRVEEDCSFLNGIFSLLLVPNGVGVGLEVDGAACLLPAFQNRHNGTAAVHPDAGRICNTASEAASAAILYRNTDRADGFACHPHRRDAFRLRRNTGHRLKAPQEQLPVASVLPVGYCVLRPAGSIHCRRPYSVIAVFATFNHISFKKESLTMSTASPNKLKVKDIILSLIHI